MEFGDVALTCRDCNKSFLFTAGEQAYYQRMGLTNRPGRCPDCRIRRKQQAMKEDCSKISSSEPPRRILPATPLPAPELPVKVASTLDNVTPTTFNLTEPAQKPASKTLLKRRWKARSLVLVLFTVQIFAAPDDDSDIATNELSVSSETVPHSIATANAQQTMVKTPTVVSEITCSKCGKRTTVPFVPQPNRPVYCASCFANK